MSAAQQIDDVLLPCPFCGAGKTTFHPNGRIWTGKKLSAPTSVSVRHWCEETPGQPSRMIERIGRDEASALAAWNLRPPAPALDTPAPAASTLSVPAVLHAMAIALKPGRGPNIDSEMLTAALNRQLSAQAGIPPAPAVPAVDEAKLAAMREKGARAWAGVPNATEWVDGLRSSVPAVREPLTMSDCLRALTSLGHEIEDDRATFFRDTEKAGNTLSQICDSLMEAIRAGSKP